MLSEVRDKWTRGDTLIEVTFALSILGAVLLSSTAIAANAFRLGQTARERTEVAEVAQEQMEALRSFRDNSLDSSAGWNQFRNGSGLFPGIDGVETTPCDFDHAVKCFHMIRQTNGTVTQWVPKAGRLDTSSTDPGSTLKVPTSELEISPSSPSGASDTEDPMGDRQCGYDFQLHYKFSPIGGGVDVENKIQTRLVNLKFNPAGGGSCP